MTSRPPDPDRARVLVVEDDEDTGEMLVSMLHDHGYAVKWTQRGEDGLRHCISTERRGTGPQVVLLDLRLPDMDGADLARGLARSMVGVPPVIVLSALPAAVMQAAARSIGAYAAVRKPFDVRRLLVSIAAAVSPSSAVIHALVPVDGIGRDLFVAMRVLEAQLPQLGNIRGGVADSAAWESAHRVVTHSMDELGQRKIAELGFDVALAQCAYLAARDAQSAFNRARIADGAAPLDFALADSYCYALLQFAIALCRRLAVPPSTGVT